MQFGNGQSGEGQSNWAKIRHVDGTIAAYSHLTEDGALVARHLGGTSDARM